MTTVIGDNNIYSSSLLSELGGATLSGNTSTQFTLSIDGYTLTVTGTGFTYSGNGPSGGTISSINVHEPTSTATSFSGLSVSAATLWSYVKSGDINDFNNLLFSGNNTFTANDGGFGSTFQAFGNGTDVFDMTKTEGADGLVGGNGVNTFIFTGASFTSGIQKTAILGGSGYNALDFTSATSSNNINLSDVANIQTINLSPSTTLPPPYNPEDSGYTYDISLGLNTACTIDGTSLSALDSMNITQFTTSSTPLYVYGGAGNDTVVIGGGNVTFNGDGGTNTVSFAQLASGVTVDLGLATQMINGANDTFVNVQDFIGTGHNDTFTDSTGKAVTVIATAGNDSMTGSGITVDYSQLPNTGGAPVQGMTFNLNTSTVTKPYGDGTDTLNGVDGIVGTGYGDTFIPNSANDYFGEDSLNGFYTNAVNFSNATGPMTFTETSETSSARTIIATSDGGATDTLVNINKIIGSPDGNTFILDDAGSTFAQGSGSDTVILTEGSAYSLGTWGSTTADASGVTTLVGSQGIGSYYSSTGNDTILMGGGGGNLYLATTGDHFVNTGLHGIDNATTTIWINDLKSNYTVTQQGNRTILNGPGGVVDTFIGSGTIQFEDDEVVGISNGGSPAAALAPYDFDGSGTSDILLQNTDGQAEIWTQYGATTIAQTQFGSNPGTTWHIVGSGDFDNNGYADILWQSNDGTVAIWETSGTAYSYLIGGGVIGNPGPSWHVIGTGDFNGDGKSDILWQNNNGTYAIWEMNGTSVIGGGILSPGGTWQAVATGDFNNDGKSDIVWQDSDGTVAIWEMNGTSVIGGGIVADAGPTWHVVGTGDFNGYGQSDILFQNNDGDVAIWEMNGTALVGGGVIGTPGVSWKVIGTGDYSGVGYSNDILFQNTNGAIAMWEMNGLSVVSGSIVGSNPGDSLQAIGQTTALSVAENNGLTSPAAAVTPGANASVKSPVTGALSSSTSNAAITFAGDPPFGRYSILPMNPGSSGFHALTA